MKKFRLIPVLTLLALLTALVTPIALASSGSAILDGMQVDATSVILMDSTTDEVLYNQNGDAKSFPASITKVMTCLLAVEAVDRGELSLDQVVTASATLYADIGAGGSTQNIKEGEQLTVRDLLACALIPSANEACNALAETVSGDVTSFVALMNQRAEELGMTGTHFTNTHGYHDENHYTTAHDVYRMTQEAMKHPTFRELAVSKEYTVPATNLHSPRVLHSTNALVSTWRVKGFYYQYATGVKTGSTPEAGYCLVSSAEKDGKTLIAVVMGGKDVTVDKQPYLTNYFYESGRLLDWGFTNFSRRTIIDRSAMDIAEMPVTLSKQANYIAVQPDGEITATLPNDILPEDFVRDWKLSADSVEAPVTRGQVLGTLTLRHGDKEYGTLNLVAVDNVERSELLYRLDRIQKFFGQLWVKLLLAAALVLIAVLVLRNIFIKKNRRGGRNAYHSRGTYSGGSRKK